MFLIYFYSEEKIVRLKRCFVCCNLSFVVSQYYLINFITL